MAKPRTVLEQNDPVARTYYHPHLNGGGSPVTAHSAEDAIARMLERKLLELCMNRFEWTGLPEEVSIRWLEMSLASRALSVFYYDDDYDRYFAQAGSGSGNLNMVGDPTEFIVWGNPFGTKTLNAVDCVPIWANYMRVPDWDIIQIYAARLASIDRTIEINAKNARVPRVLQYDENSSLTMAQIDRLYDGGAPVLKVNSSLDLSGIQVLDLGVDPSTILNLSLLRARIENDVMTLLGVNNANQDKKERLVAAEVSGNDDKVAAIRATNLNARQQAAEQINRQYGLNVEVDYVTDMVTAELKNTGLDAGTDTDAGSDD